MTDDTKKRIAIEWQHSRDDHLIVLEYQFLYSSMSPFGVATRRRARRLIFLMFFIPIAVIYLLNINQQDMVSTLLVAGVSSFLFWTFVIKKTKPDAIAASTKKLARRYVDGANILPIGTHQLTTDGHTLEWRWIDGDELSSYPISTIEDVCESDGRMFLIRKGEATDSIPFHAFGDQQTRVAFLEMIKNSNGK